MPMRPADRDFTRSSYSASDIWHVSFRFIRNFWSADRELRVSSRSCLSCASFASVSASSCVFLSFSSLPALISFSFAAFRSSYASCPASSSFWLVDRFVSNLGRSAAAASFLSVFSSSWCK